MSIQANKVIVRRYFAEAPDHPEIWDISDRLWLWQQLGVLPNLKEAVAVANRSDT